LRVGLGFAAQPLIEGNGLILCGVSIPFNKGLPKNKKDDAVILSVADALLGAAGLGCVNNQFPETNRKCAEINLNLLKEGYKIINIDLSIVLEKPDIISNTKKITENLAKNLFLKPEQINIKAAKAEGLSSLADDSAVICFSICLLDQRRG
jgi:2-C-methyl-D-erythritol 2,4-cyclodiphosphate synthase